VEKKCYFAELFKNYGFTVKNNYRISINYAFHRKDIGVLKIEPYFTEKMFIIITPNN